MDDTTKAYQQELCTMRREYFVALAVLREAIKARAAQYSRDRTALARKYNLDQPDKIGENLLT